LGSLLPRVKKNNNNNKLPELRKWAYTETVSKFTQRHGGRHSSAASNNDPDMYRDRCVLNTFVKSLKWSVFSPYFMPSQPLITTHSIYSTIPPTTTVSCFSKLRPQAQSS